MRPQTKKLCRAESAAEVIGPVDSGERMIAKKGASRDGRGNESISAQKRNHQLNLGLQAT
jgi:hypothetical protein